MDYCRAAAELGAKAVSVMDVSLTPEVVATGRGLGLVVYSWVRNLEVQDQVIASRSRRHRDRLGQRGPGLDSLDQLARAQSLRPISFHMTKQMIADPAIPTRVFWRNVPQPSPGITTLSTNDGPPQR